MGFLLSCSLDASVRMYDLQGGVEKNRFIGHRAGVVAIAYSNEYRFLLSAGSDHQVCVWSPFSQKQVYSLRGHNAPLIGVQFVPGTPQIVTADSDGWMKIWDARNFTCCQTFFTMPQLTSFTACSQRHKRIFVVGKCHELRIYEQEGGPFLKRKQEEPILTAMYSPFTMTILTANRDDVKVYDALTGHLSRVYRGLAESELTAVCLDSRQRKLFIGDQQGKIRGYNYLTGAYMKSMTPHQEEVISMCYCGSRRLLISATDRTVFVHDERPIEEAVLYMTITSGEGAEYLVVSVSDQLSSLACAMSNGKIDLWNLDQAMRDVPIQGGHPDVITALNFLDSHQLLLSADDSGEIMAWFVRPSRWKGQLAFQLHTPPTIKDAASTGLALPTQALAAPEESESMSSDPIRRFNAQSNVSGISCMCFHAPSSQLFCGHRNGQIQVWNLKPMLDFLARVVADPTASWFVNTHTTATANSAKASRQSSTVRNPSNGGSSSSVGSGSLLSPSSSSSSLLLSSGRRSAVSFPKEAEKEIKDPYADLPIKDQLARIANNTKPCNTILAHDTVVSTLSMCLSPPALLSATVDHVTHIWSLDGDPMGVLDPVVGLAKGYEMSTPTGKSAAAAAASMDNEWQFRVDVATRAAQDRATTHNVLKELESMALEAQQQQQRLQHMAAEGVVKSDGTASRGPLTPSQSKQRLPSIASAGSSNSSPKPTNSTLATNEEKDSAARSPNLRHSSLGLTRDVSSSRRSLTAAAAPRSSFSSPSTSPSLSSSSLLRSPPSRASGSSSSSLGLASASPSGSMPASKRASFATVRTERARIFD